MPPPKKKTNVITFPDHHRLFSPTKTTNHSKHKNTQTHTFGEKEQTLTWNKSPPITIVDDQVRPLRSSLDKDFHTRTPRRILSPRLSLPLIQAELISQQNTANHEHDRREYHRSVLDHGVLSQRTRRGDVQWDLRVVLDWELRTIIVWWLKSTRGGVVLMDQYAV